MKKQSDEIIQGIVCGVSSCEYNDGCAHCVATQVAIGPSKATCCAETACATFKPKSEAAEGKIFS